MENTHEAIEYTRQDSKCNELDENRNWEEIIRLQLTCPVCGNLPQPGPVYACRNGHVTCESCRKRTKFCPSCREKDTTCRAMYLEAMLEKISDKITASCIWHQCPVSKKPKEIRFHQEICIERIMQCPTRIFDTCKYTGTLQNLLHHADTTLCCKPLARNKVSMLQGQELMFTEEIKDQNGSSRNQASDWRPFLFSDSAPQITGIGALLVRRRQGGTWDIMVQMMVSEQVINSYQITITALNTNNKHSPQYTFQGKAIHQDMKPDDAMSSGQFLSLHDVHVNKLRGPKKDHVCNIKISVKIDEDLRQKLSQNQTDIIWPETTRTRHM